MAEKSKIADFFDRVFMETFTKRLLGPSGGDAGSAPKEKSWLDNAKYATLLLMADNEVLTKNSTTVTCSQKIHQLVDYLIGQMDESVRTKMMEVAQKGIDAGVSTLVLAPNATEQLRHLVALPIVSLFSTMATQSEEKAKTALIQFCSQNVEDMFPTYVLIAAQPETISDQAKRGLGWLKEKYADYEKSAAANIAKANAPGGITWKTKQHIANRKRTKNG